MLFQSIRKNINKNRKVDLETLCEETIQIRTRSELIMIVPKPTGNSWRGIYNGALAFAPDYLLALPQYYSQPLYSEKELAKLCSSLVDADFSKIIFSGFPGYFGKLIKLIHEFKTKAGKDVRQFLIYHGSLSSNREDRATVESLNELLALQRAGKIFRIGFIKKGMSETFQKLAGINGSHLIPKTPLHEINQVSVVPGGKKINIGVFTHDQYRKNIDNQLAAALMIPNAKVHTHDDHQFGYLQQDDRIFFHPFIESYPGFLALIKSMTLNFYVTFSECFGLFITESLALGVPCLASDNSGVFDYDEWLHEKLIVKEFDNSNAIYEQAKMILDCRDEIAARGLQYVTRLNAIADEKYKSFLNA